ncbi:MAG: hypothetical protein KY393_08645 [Actinobacteria bacterium]|nr:hypothetical protein [Actinomycetota bacterium]
MKFLPTRIHGILDYLEGLLLLVLAALTAGSLRVTCLVVGIAILGLSVFTRYELGVIRVVPMPVHLLMDGVAGVVLIAGGAANWGRSMSLVVVIIGIFTIGAALVTQTSPTEA